MSRRKVKGPNGLVFNLPELTATGLVGKGNRGYEYVDGSVGSGTDQGDTPVEKMTVKQLKAYADERDIDLGEASKKADILAVLEASSADGSEGSEGNAELDPGESTEEQE